MKGRENTVFIGCIGYPICRYTREKIDNEYYFLKTEVRLVELMDWRDRLNFLILLEELKMNRKTLDKIFHCIVVGVMVLMINIIILKNNFSLIQIHSFNI